jgi:lipopolysaccharide export system protein LptA
MMRRAADRLRPALLLCVLIPLTAVAQQTRDRGMPMDIEADHTDATLGADGRAVLRGNVAIRQGTLRIDSDVATLQRRAGEFQQIVLEGAPARMEQQLDAGGLTRAQARRIDYDPQGQVVVLTGDVVVTQPEGSMRGERITYNMQSGNLQGGEADGRSRIRMRIEPRQPATD